MQGNKEEKILEEMRKFVAEYIQRESNYNSMITVTHSHMSGDFKKATFFVTVLPETQENAALDFLKRNRKNVKQLIKSKSKLSRLPQVDFEIDKGEKVRQRLDTISREIEE